MAGEIGRWSCLVPVERRDSCAPKHGQEPRLLIAVHTVGEGGGASDPLENAHEDELAERGRYATKNRSQGKDPDGCSED